MKKALVILLTLAVAGGLFAQTWTGVFEAGVAVISRGDSDDMHFALLSPIAGANGTRLEVRVNHQNADATAGFRAWIRGANVRDATVTDAGTNHFQWANAFGWIRFMDGMLELRGGRINNDDWGFANKDGISANGWTYGRQGIAARVNATDMFSIGVGGFSTFQPSQLTTWDGGGLTLWAALRANIVGTADISAGMEFSGTAMNANAGVAIRAINNVPIGVGLSLYRLDEFADMGRIYVQGNIGLNMLSPLSLTLQASFGTSNRANEDDIALGAGVALSYPIGNIVPMLNAYYVTGATHPMANMYGVQPIDFVGGGTFNSNQSYISFRPSVQVRVTGTQFWHIGALINYEMGDVAAAGGNADNPLSFAVFTGVRAAF